MKDHRTEEEAEAMGEERFRLVVLGSSRAGKTSIIHRYLHKEFSGRYKETVEEMYSRQFRIRGVALPLDILDTNINFPDMRRISIATASAFMLVFAVDNVQSFKEMSELWQEICTRRADIGMLPVVVVGNKCDLPSKKIYEATATAWISRLSTEVRYLEVSAKEDINITAIFRNLLQLSGFPKCKAGGGSLEPDEGESETHSPPSIERAGSYHGRPVNKTVHAMVSEGHADRDLLRSALSLGLPSEMKRGRSLRMSTRRDKEGVEKSLEEPKLSRTSSLIKRTKHLSLKMRRHGEKPAEQIPDDSDCVIS